jgi:hypothetical protein
MENNNELKGFWKGVAAAFIAFAGILIAGAKL